MEPGTHNSEVEGAILALHRTVAADDDDRVYQRDGLATLHWVGVSAVAHCLNDVRFDVGEVEAITEDGLAILIECLVLLRD